MVKKRFPEKMDESRLDAAIALYMRCTGYTPQEVANELYRHTPGCPHGQNHDERIDYERRVIWYAFGTVGDIDIATTNPIPEQIKSVAQEAGLTKEETPQRISRLRKIRGRYLIF